MTWTMFSYEYRLSFVHLGTFGFRLKFYPFRLVYTPVDHRPMAMTPFTEVA